jgi:hypothetical protein
MGTTHIPHMAAMLFRQQCDDSTVLTMGAHAQYDALIFPDFHTHTVANRPLA